MKERELDENWSMAGVAVLRCLLRQVRGFVSQANTENDVDRVTLCSEYAEERGTKRNPALFISDEKR